MPEVHCDGVDDVVPNSVSSSNSSEVRDEQRTEGSNIGKDIIRVSESVSASNNNKEYVTISLRKDAATSIYGMVQTGLNLVGSNLGAVSFGSAVAAQAVKITPHLPPAGRLDYGVAAGSIGTVSATVSLKVGDAISKNEGLHKAILSSPHSDPNIERIPSPGLGPINSPLESGDMFHTPLEDLLGYSLILNYLILLLVILFILVIYNRYIYIVKIVKY